MTRIITSLALALLLAIAGSVAFDTMRGPGPTAAAAKGLKTCTAKTPAGVKKTWKCGSDEACCVNHTLGLYVCGFPGLGCL